MERGKQKITKKEIANNSNSNSEENFGQQTSSSGERTNSTGNLKEVEPLLKNFIQNLNEFQSRWNEGWTELTQRLDEINVGHLLFA